MIIVAIVTLAVLASMAYAIHAFTAAVKASADAAEERAMREFQASFDQPGKESA